MGFSFFIFYLILHSCEVLYVFQCGYCTVEFTLFTIRTLQGLAPSRRHLRAALAGSFSPRWKRRNCLTTTAATNSTPGKDPIQKCHRPDRAIRAHSWQSGQQRVRCRQRQIPKDTRKRLEFDNSCPVWIYNRRDLVAPNAFQVFPHFSYSRGKSTAAAAPSPSPG